MIGLLWAEKSRLKWGGGVMMEMLIMVAPNLKNWLKSSTWAMTTMEVSGGLWTSFCWTNVYGKDIWAQVAHFWPEWWISLLVMVSEMLCAVHPSLNFIQLTFSGIRHLDHHRWNSLLVTVFDVDGKEGGAKDDATGGGDAEDRVDCRLNPRLFHLRIRITSFWTAKKGRVHYDSTWNFVLLLRFEKYTLPFWTSGLLAALTCCWTSAMSLGYT